MCLTLGPCDAGLRSKVTVAHVGGVEAVTDAVK